ncbi:type II toxin-antitoxin system RelE/ParE family toxin [Maioricimonas sp. JC845]|uniref:type II toxin-antitoxin system RelE/ParE family toxin n=1 Tax=Maioricimonas sp. JC845 TaxID=3232138 RepID=UPI00345822DC
MRILRTPQAESDLAQIWQYIARDDTAAADRLIRQISASFEMLANNPDLGIKLNEVRPGLMCKPVRKWYVVFFEVRGDSLCVLRVLHGARHYEDLV